MVGGCRRVENGQIKTHKELSPCLRCLECSGASQYERIPFLPKGHAPREGDGTPRGKERNASEMSGPGQKREIKPKTKGRHVARPSRRTELDWSDGDGATTTPQGAGVLVPTALLAVDRPSLTSPILPPRVPDDPKFLSRVLLPAPPRDGHGVRVVPGLGGGLFTMGRSLAPGRNTFP